MKILIEQDYNAMSAKAARMISDFIKNKPDAVLSLPTGSSPEGTLSRMVEIAGEEGVDYSGLSLFNMDEYVPLKKEDPQSYYYFLKSRLYDQVNVDLEKTFRPDVTSEDLESACRDYAGKIREHGGFDLILLGIGRDGHIAFNMPRPSLYAEPHVEALNEDTIAANARFFSDPGSVPRSALSIGIGTILNSRKILLVASGSGKAEILGKAFSTERINPDNPASFLHLHEDVTLILDKDAAGALQG